ncbi:uncharacterized protein JCM6883_003887 [Sporobolomyces salmoneus]|uniref:uncharacterized protein n=1 Tax=Sporobolomyces salmoneus TaxID=183962 RepID=UPI00317A88D3
MPIPFIPPEVIAEVLSKFHVGHEAEIVETAGKSISLVCRSWRPLGRALRWRDVSIKPSSASSLHDHLISYPDVANLVQKLRIQDPNAAKKQDDEAKKLQHHAPSLKLLPRLLGINELELEFWNCEQLEEFFIVCSRLPKLVSISLVGLALYIRPRMKTALLEGFPMLQFLDLRLLGLFQTANSLPDREEEEEEAQGSSIASPPSKSLLRSLELRVQWLFGPDLFAPAGSAPAWMMYEILKGAFDWSQLKSCLLAGSFVTPSLLLDLARLPNLDTLVLLPVDLGLEELFAIIVDNLPQMVNIKNFIVKESSKKEDVFVSPVVLWKFFDLIPSSLELLALPQFAFDPDGVCEFPDASEFWAQGKEARRTLSTLAYKDCRLVLREFDTESGREWCE